MNFATYLRHHAKARRNPVGDFIRDARADTDFPPTIASWPRLKGYLYACNACPEAVTAAKNCWRNYNSWLKTRNKTA